MNSKFAFRLSSLVACSALLVACGGGGGGGGGTTPPPPAGQTYSVGGTVSGLASGATVVLQNNGGNNLSITSNGAFTFSTELDDGDAYAVTVLTQPTSPGSGQNCTITNGSGTINDADVTNVTVTCQNADPTAPTVTAQAPLPNAVGSALQGGVITVTFSEAIDTATVTSSSFTVEDASGPISGAITFASGNTQAIFTPTARLAYDQTYTVTVTTAVRDPSGNPLPAESAWRFNTGKRLAVGFLHTCARFEDGRVKCWGDNAFGQLGYDDTSDRGNGVGTNTNALAAVNLGAGRTAVALAAGDHHTCAILDNGGTKCWGRNSSGELGQGNTANLGNSSGEMAALQPINFGSGRRAVEIAGGQGFTCARLDDNSVKCWGDNTSGRLGRGNTAPLGVAAGDIAAAAPINFGTGLTPVALSLGHHHACAILVDSSGDNQVKCWGDNRWGQLGLGDVAHRGDAAGEMGDALPAVNLGTGVSAEYVIATGGHNCVKLSDLATKCWGLNTWGQVGLDVGNNMPALANDNARQLCTGANDCIGDVPGEMGDVLLPAIAAGNTDRLTVGFRHSCVILTSGELQCWGSNQQGQLGLEDITGAKAIIGDANGEISALADTALKPGAVVEELTGGGFHTCVQNIDDTINCWGWNTDGQLGHNDTATWGDGPNEMGASLPDTDLGT